VRCNAMAWTDETTVQAVERTTKRQCKKDEHQTEALLAKARDWNAHMFDQKSVESVMHQVTLVKECLNEARALAKRKGETLPWLECLPRQPNGIHESKRLALFVSGWRRAPHEKQGSS
jgi:hypothetical protein